MFHKNFLVDSLFCYILKSMAQNYAIFQHKQMFLCKTEHIFSLIVVVSDVSQFAGATCCNEKVPLITCAWFYKHFVISEILWISLVEIHCKKLDILWSSYCNLTLLKNGNEIIQDKCFFLFDMFWLISILRDEE